jgi:hypothetical protein
VRARVAPLLRHGWQLRVLWRRQSENTLPRLLRYLLSVDRGGSEGDEHEPDTRTLRIGPLFIDHFPSRRRAAIKLLRCRQLLYHWARDCNHQRARAEAAEAKLRELQRVMPSMRGGAT